MKKKWKIRHPGKEAIQSLSQKLRVSPIVATVMANRGINSPELAEPYLNPSLADLAPPFSLKDMDRAVHRIYTALIQKERILVFGDYDVDGVTSTIILFQFLEQAGGNVHWYIPHRTMEGYGLKRGKVIEQAFQDGVSLIVTADCGSASHDAIQAAAAKGIDTVVTDHHEIGKEPSAAVAVVNPKRSDCLSGLESLAGAGVAFYLAIGLRRFLREKSFWENTSEPNLKSYCDLVALGTTADLVPLTGINRILVKTGISIINRSPRKGITALAEKASCEKGKIDEGDLSFRLCPRLNAAGRIDHAGAAMTLLTAEDEKSAGMAAAHLDRLNETRREIESAIYMEIIQHIHFPSPHKTIAPLVLHSDEWHEGVLGIVASRLVETVHRPVVLISLKNGLGKGSARSIPGINLHQCLLACSAHLEAFGGHAMAAGLSIKPDRIDDFRKCLEDIVAKEIAGRELIPELAIDAEITFDQISTHLTDDLERLKPFGPKNREPVFMSKNIYVLSSKILVKKHLRMVLTQHPESNGSDFPAIQFNADPDDWNTSFFQRVAYRIQWNRWNGKKTLQLLIEGTDTRQEFE